MLHQDLLKFWDLAMVKVLGYTVAEEVGQDM